MMKTSYACMSSLEKSDAIAIVKSFNGHDNVMDWL